MIVWIIGLSGAGKSSVGRELSQALRRETGKPVVYLDGDELRKIWGDSLGYTVEARRQNAHRISHLCRLLDHNGVTAVATVLAIFPEWLDWNRANLSSYFEVFLDVPIDVLEYRDPKGLYAAFRKGEIDNVIGKDIPFFRPANPDLVIDNGAERTNLDSVVQEILWALKAQQRQ